MALYLLLLGVPMILGLFAQWRVRSAFGKYSKVLATSNITGAEAARSILVEAGIGDVEVTEINGMLGDHYDPTKKRLCLSSATYNEPSVAALGIAAHEVGHAIQHAKAYGPLKARMAVVPLTMYASQLLPFIMFGGFLVPVLFPVLIKTAVVIYLVLTVFQLITLPVEFDASRRAKVILGHMGMIQPGAETVGVNRVLNAAALTYVAAFIAALGNLAYLFLISRDR